MKTLIADCSGDNCRELQSVNRLRAAGLMEENGNNDGFFCLPLDQFRVQGPNGSHMCFVYPVAGPRPLVSPKFLTTRIGCYGKLLYRLRVLWLYLTSMEFVTVVSHF